MSVAQRRDRLRRTLIATQRYGDRDECQLKHFEWCIAALLCGQHWFEAADYDNPWGSRLDEVPKMAQARWRQTWEKIEQFRDTSGIEEFTADLEAILARPDSPYLFMPDEWSLEEQRRSAA